MSTTVLGLPEPPLSHPWSTHHALRAPLAAGPVRYS